MTAITTPVATAPRRSTGGHATALRLTGTNLRLMAREPMVAVGTLGFPLVTVLVIAGVFGQAPDPEFGGVAPDDHYLAGYIGVVLGALGLITLPVLIATQRELGVPRRFRASGVSGGVQVASDVLLGMALGTSRWRSSCQWGRRCTGCERPTTCSVSSGGTPPA